MTLLPCWRLTGCSASIFLTPLVWADHAIDLGLSSTSSPCSPLYSSGWLSLSPSSKFWPWPSSESGRCPLQESPQWCHPNCFVWNILTLFKSSETIIWPRVRAACVRGGADAALPGDALLLPLTCPAPCPAPWTRAWSRHGSILTWDLSEGSHYFFDLRKLYFFQACLQLIIPAELYTVWLLLN